ncbi:MAG TPA: polyribonucleotide nucleotidyltransferase [Acidimicrobiia bacterium]|nr:polyribonucleotide nucleotidyltransferase [Acidimicrobiia bacterium]
MPEYTVRGVIGDKEVTITTGKLAGQADGAVTIRLGDTVVLVTATANKTMREGIDFFPLTVDVEERMYAAGKIPGSFFRREGRATEKAILTCRLIDRPLRPSFKEGYRCETQVVATILSVDNVNAYDIISLNGASAALSVSSIPFEGPVGAVRMSLKDGEWTVLPTYEELEGSVFELTVAGGRNANGEIDIIMVEAGATEDGVRLIKDGQPPSDEATVARGMEASKAYIAQLIDLQKELADQVEIAEYDWPLAVDYTDELAARVEAVARPKYAPVVLIAGKQERNAAQDEATEAILAELAIEDEDELAMAKKAARSVIKKMMRERVVNDGIRLDGRGLRDIRQLTVDVGVVPRTHGSGLFQRGETQVLNLATLGMLKMEQMLDTLSIEESKRYMHHYNFPPFSTGEAGFMRGPKRREIGHGALAEKAVLPVIPTADEFPYALRLVSEVLASNGSSSMASVCSSSLSLMDAGVPIIAPVAGIAMGLIAHEQGFATLTDILGAEDALGDMDFKVAGTADIITALQLDTKISGLPSEVLAGALDQAKEARLAILQAMADVIDGPRSELNPWAPRIEAVQIPKDKIGEIIGPKGKNIRELEEVTGATIEIEEDGAFGIVRIGTNDSDSLALAKEKVMQIAFPPEPEVGETYDGEVVNITSFGAFVNILPGRDGLIHISKLDTERRVERVEDYVALGDKIKVNVREIDRAGKVNLDLAVPLEPKEGAGERPAGGDRDRSRRDSGDRDRGRREGGDGRDRDRGGREGGGGRDRDRGGREGGGGRDRDRGGREGGGGRDRDGGSRDAARRRDGGNDRDRGNDRGGDKPGRRVVSFEDQFESGLDD